MRIFMIVLILIPVVFQLILKFLTYSRRNAPIPENVQDVYDAQTYQKQQAYSMDKLKYSIVSESIIGTMIAIAVMLLNVHAHVYDWIYNITSNQYITNIVTFLLPLLIILLIDCVLGIYDTFVIEAKYGFNKTTPRIFVFDFLKNTLMISIIYGGLLALFIVLHQHLNNGVFVVFIAILFLLLLLQIFISPIILRMMNKLTPLEDGSLKERIETLAAKHQFKLNGIYSVDASKRSSKVNAFASGFGKTKTIGLFDTLIEKMNEDEIVAVLAHEIAHAKYRHSLKSAPLSILKIVFILLISFTILNILSIYTSFGFDSVNIAFAMFILVFLYQPIGIILGIPGSALSRKHEYEADAFACHEVSPEIMISALKKLARENLGNLTPHPFVVMVEYSHPPISDRIAAMEEK